MIKLRPVCDRTVNGVACRLHEVGQRAHRVEPAAHLLYFGLIAGGFHAYWLAAAICFGIGGAALWLGGIEEVQQ